MKYLLLICGDDESYQAMLDDETFLPDCGGWSEERERRGMLLGTGGLQGPDDATTARVGTTTWRRRSSPRCSGSSSVDKGAVDITQCVMVVT